jgi:hypothetical protein
VVRKVDETKKMRDRYISFVQGRTLEAAIIIRGWPSVDADYCRLEREWMRRTDGM